MMQHLVHRDRERVVVTKNGLRQRIAHQNHLNPGLVDQARSGVIVSSKASDRFVPEFSFPQRSGSNLQADLVRTRKSRTPAHRGETHFSSSAPPARPDRACSASSWTLALL